MSGLSGNQTISRQHISAGIDVILSRGLVTVTLERLGCAQDGDQVTRVVRSERNDFEDEM